jgi:hypothetical protein
MPECLVPESLSDLTAYNSKPAAEFRPLAFPNHGLDGKRNGNGASSANWRHLFRNAAGAKKLFDPVSGFRVQSLRLSRHALRLAPSSFDLSCAVRATRPRDSSSWRRNRHLHLIRVTTLAPRCAYGRYVEIIGQTSLDRAVRVVGGRIERSIDSRKGTGGDRGAIDIVSRHTAGRARVPAQRNTVLRRSSRTSQRFYGRRVGRVAGKRGVGG